MKCVVPFLMIAKSRISLHKKISDFDHRNGGYYVKTAVLEKVFHVRKEDGKGNQPDFQNPVNFYITKKLILR